MTEIWKDVIGYEGLYQVSNHGRVKSLPRTTTHLHIMKPRKDRGGYLYLGLTKNGINKSKKVHRLVAQAFIPNPQNKYSVNHKDGDKTNNNVENLEWATHKEQAQHAFKIGLWKWTEERINKVRKTNGKKFGKSICKLDSNYKVICVYDTMSLASRENNIPVPDLVRACKVKTRTANGFYWRYRDEVMRNEKDTC